MNMENWYNSVVEFDRERFSQYIRDRFYKWRGSTDKTWVDFAEYLGVTQPTMAAWKNAYLKRPLSPRLCADDVAQRRGLAHHFPADGAFHHRPDPALYCSIR